ncbi:hypothetical protein LX32DRAFT_696758 [Colletotrichum zoysiae]|uniref:Uncharacterized protein n=1 Tax=Colletotrichum zoysiae TaxID=1216348 RepID=A0AAD9HAV6_9PEZI|nr:hypothetical protein LX32DRAFT_696758 [Colletotrichum zoysiae]
MPFGISAACLREPEMIVRLQPDEEEKAVMILRWTLFAVRPLQVKQLAETLIESDNDLDRYPEDDLPDPWYEGVVDEDHVKEMILGRCGSLLQLRSSSAETPLAEFTVHFVHFSVGEYLSNLSATSATNHWANELCLSDSPVEETRFSTIALAASRSIRLTFNDIPGTTEMYPFLSYAAWAWYFHGYHEKPTPTQDS